MTKLAEKYTVMERKLKIERQAHQEEVFRLKQSMKNLEFNNEKRVSSRSQAKDSRATSEKSLGNVISKKTIPKGRNGNYVPNGHGKGVPEDFEFGEDSQVLSDSTIPLEELDEMKNQLMDLENKLTMRASKAY